MQGHCGSDHRHAIRRGHRDHRCRPRVDLGFRPAASARASCSGWGEVRGSTGARYRGSHAMDANRYRDAAGAGRPEIRRRGEGRGGRQDEASPARTRTDCCRGAHLSGHPGEAYPARRRTGCFRGARHPGAGPVGKRRAWVRPDLASALAKPRPWTHATAWEHRASERLHAHRAWVRHSAPGRGRHRSPWASVQDVRFSPSRPASPRSSRG